MIAEMILVSLMGSAAHADEGKPLELPPPPAPISDSKSKVKFSSSCTNATGSTVKASEPGYDSCVLESATNKNNSMNGSHSKNSPGAGSPAQNMEVKFGN